MNQQQIELKFTAYPTYSGDNLPDYIRGYAYEGKPIETIDGSVVIDMSSMHLDSFPLLDGKENQVDEASVSVVKMITGKGLSFGANLSDTRIAIAWRNRLSMIESATISLTIEGTLDQSHGGFASVNETVVKANSVMRKARVLFARISASKEDRSCLDAENKLFEQVANPPKTAYRPPSSDINVPHIVWYD